jgi:UPF0271 protein
MDRVILNCDLGENEPREVTARLMQTVHAANIACGGHAGGTATMKYCLTLCRDFGVLPGAHPGMAGEFGRGTTLPEPTDFHSMLRHQVRTFSELADEAGLSIHHIKLHGALYHAVEKSDVLAAAYLDFVLSLPVRPAVFCMAGGLFSRRARNAGLDVRDELFLDRQYLDPHLLAPRSDPEAVLDDADMIVDRLRGWLDTGTIAAQDGRALNISAQTLCLHGDAAASREAARQIRAILDAQSGP